MLLRGVIFHPSQFENLFVSLVHTDADIDQTLAAAAEVFPSSPPSGRQRRRDGPARGAAGAAARRPHDGRPAGRARRLRYQDVMAMVERLIAERGSAPGDLLPSRAELAAMAGVSLDHRAPRARRARTAKAACTAIRAWARSWRGRAS